MSSSAAAALNTRTVQLSRAAAAGTTSARYTSSQKNQPMPITAVTAGGGGLLRGPASARTPNHSSHAPANTASAASNSSPQSSARTASSAPVSSMSAPSGLWGCNSAAGRTAAVWDRANAPTPSASHTPQRSGAGAASAKCCAASHASSTSAVNSTPTTRQPPSSTGTDKRCLSIRSDLSQKSYSLLYAAAGKKARPGKISAGFAAYSVVMWLTQNTPGKGSGYRET